MNKNTLSKLERLKSQRAKLGAKIQATQAQAKHSERKDETRRKILIGSYFLEQTIKTNQMESLKQKMDGYLKREADRLLFALPVLDTKGNKDQKC